MNQLIKTSTASTAQTVTDAVALINRTAGMVKLICGLSNNAAYMLTLDAWDRIKHLDLTRRVEGGHELRWHFLRVLRAFKSYERALIYADENRFFHVAGMPKDVRKRYGNITDRDYYDMWSALGAEAYQRNRAMVTCLVNKYRLMLEANGVKDADVKAWASAAILGLAIARNGYDSAMTTAINNVPVVKPDALRRIFSAFSLETVARLWFNAVQLLDGRALALCQEANNERNIRLSVEQLQDAWLGDDVMADALRSTVTGYDDVWRTKGEMKKALREVDDFYQEMKETE